MGLFLLMEKLIAGVVPMSVKLENYILFVKLIFLKFFFFQNYSSDFKRLTGQSTDYLFIISQQHAYGSTAGDSLPQSTLAAWNAAKSNTNIICIPKYQYTYYSDGVHEDAHGYTFE
jgi:hypothetical protein